MVAACSKAVSPRREGQGDAVELADLFCRDAARRVEALFRSLRDNDDSRNYKLAQAVMGNTYRWLEEGIL